MLNALTVRERRLLLGILAILLLGAMVKWWRWRMQEVEKADPADEEEVACLGGNIRSSVPAGIVIIGGEFPVVAA
jgi:hypothetical protein